MADQRRSVDLKNYDVDDLARDRLGSDGVNLVHEQLRSIRAMNAFPYRGGLRDRLLAGQAMPADTLIHGLYNECNADVLRSILETGVVTGDIRGIREDGETFGCADFWRVRTAATVPEFFAAAFAPTAKPGGLKGASGVRNTCSRVAIIVDAHAPGVAELCRQDAYRNPALGSKLRLLPDEHEPAALAAILGGVPTSAIAAVVIGDDVARRAPDANAMLAICRERGVPVMNHGGRLYDRAIESRAPSLER